MVFSIGVIVYMIIANYIGFNISSSSSNLCNTYLSLKFQRYQRIIYSVAFTAAGTNLLLCAILFTFFLFILIKYLKNKAPD